MAATKSAEHEFYPYSPNKVLPIVFSVLVGTSLVVHVVQNFYYRFWRVTFYMFYGGLLSLTGWVLRAIFARNPTNLNLYIAQTVFILSGPPIYSAAEYIVFSRILRYLPMHAPISPTRVIFFFTYLSALVESLTAAGGSMMARSTGDMSRARRGTVLVAIAVVLQGVVQLSFAATVGVMHLRTARANMLTPKVRTVFIMLYGTSVLIILRCVYRAIEKFSMADLYKKGACEGLCRSVILNEWYLYAFEAAPMVLYTLWINVIHPGRFLPRDKRVFLDYQGVERSGPEEEKKRNKKIRWMSLLDMGVGTGGDAPKDRFWERPEQWPEVVSEGNQKNIGLNSV